MTKKPLAKPMDSTERVAFTVQFGCYATRLHCPCLLCSLLQKERTPMPGGYKTVLLNLIVLVDGEAEAELCVDQ